MFAAAFVFMLVIPVSTVHANNCEILNSCQPCLSTEYLVCSPTDPNPGLCRNLNHQHINCGSGHGNNLPCDTDGQGCMHWCCSNPDASLCFENELCLLTSSPYQCSEWGGVYREYGCLLPGGQGDCCIPLSYEGPCIEMGNSCNPEDSENRCCNPSFITCEEDGGNHYCMGVLPPPQDRPYPPCPVNVPRSDGTFNCLWDETYQKCMVVGTEEDNPRQDSCNRSNGFYPCQNLCEDLTQEQCQSPVSMPCLLTNDCYDWDIGDPRVPATCSVNELGQITRHCNLDNGQCFELLCRDEEGRLTCLCFVGGDVNNFCWTHGPGSRIPFMQKIFCDNSNPPKAVEAPPDPNHPRIFTAIGCIPVGTNAEFGQFLLRWGMGIGGGIAFIMIVYSGFLIISSAGNPQKLQAGKELLVAAISGLLLLVFSVFILRFTGVDILQLPGLTPN
jgi:hypothetical protein